MPPSNLAPEKNPNKSPLPTGISSTVSPQPLRFRPAAGLDVRSIMKGVQFLAIIVCFLFTLAIASANPVDVNPAGPARAYVYVLIAVGCIVIEMSILCLICRVFHDADCDLGMKASIAGLNIATLIIILMPLLRLTNSVLIAELGVIVAEAVGIKKIFALNGVRLSLARSSSYSLGVNLVSYAIGVMCQ